MLTAVLRRCISIFSKTIDNLILHEELLRAKRKFQHVHVDLRQ